MDCVRVLMKLRTKAPVETSKAKETAICSQMAVRRRFEVLPVVRARAAQATNVVPGYLDLWNVDDTIVQQYREVVATVGEHGAYYFVELSHPGRQSHYTGPETDFYEAPSATPLLIDGVDRSEERRVG